MLESIKHYAEALSGLTEVPRERARRIAKSLSKQGVIPTGQIRSVAKDIAERSRENRERVTKLVATQVRRQASMLGLATSDEIDRLRRRVVALEGGSPSKTTAAKGARKASKKAAPRKRAAAASRTKAKPATKARKAPRKRASATRRR